MFYVKPDDIAMTRRILKEELPNKDLDDAYLQDMAENILNTAYSIGSAYDEISIRKIIKTMITSKMI